MNGREGYSDPLAEARQHLEQAYAYEERDEFENALRECELAIQLAPGLAELHNLRGIVLEELGRKREAIAAYREAVRLDPAFREAQENLSEAEAELREERKESPKVEVAHQLEVLACSVCGRQDETLRAVVYPYVFSLVIVTFRRAFAGLWCRKHRNLRLVLASLITATIGWIGIPFGFFFTPVALFKLARGGDQPAELNANMLRALAGNKLQEGDAKGAIRCLEASLQFHDDDTARERLRELRMNFGLPVYEGGCQRVVLTIAGILLVAVLIGAAIGVLDYVITAVFSSLLGGEVLIYVVILSWAPFVAMAFIGGLILFQLIEWALARIKCRRLSIAISIGIVTAVLATYSLLQGSAMSDYVTALLSDGVFESVLDAIFTGILVLLLGGVFWILGFTEPANTSEAIYIVLLLVIGIYYSIMAVLTAIRTTRWQQRLIT